METNNRFLNKLQHDIPLTANNYMLSTYSIILEAWRRGIEVSISIKREASGNIETYYVLKNDEKKHHFSTTRGDLIPRETIDITKNKHKTKEFLLKNNVPVPNGKIFDDSDSNPDIITASGEIGYPLVVKPVNGTGGKGVIANIRNKTELDEAIVYVREKLGYPHIIVEKYFEGHDYRLYVIGGEVVGAIKRLKANVKGDGEKNLKELIKEKNRIRTAVPALKNRPIKVDEETLTLLNRDGLDLDYVPKKNEVVFLKTKNNVSAGGDSIEITNQISEKIKNIAVSATKSFNSMVQCGVDLIVDEEENQGVVIELNTRAHITQHLFPMEGKAVDIPSKIIDYYFPETKDIEDYGQYQFYVDYDYIYNSSLSRNSKEITIPPLPNGPLILKRFELMNCSFSDQLAKRIRRIAFNNKVDGYIKPLNSGNIVVVVGGNEEKIKKFKKQMEKRIKSVNSDSKVEIKKRNTPIKHGFHIVGLENNSDNSSTTSEYFRKYNKLKNDYQRVVRRLVEYEQMEKEMTLTKKQNRNLRKEISQIEDSTSWKVTKPLRGVIDKLKK